jgi:molybdate transport system substrate-binding protein
MRFIRSASQTGLAVAILLVHPVAAQTGDIKVLCSTGFKAVMEDLVPQFERATHHKVAVRYGLAAVLRQQIEAGEAFDLAILTPAAIDDLIKVQKVAADSRTILAQSGLGIAIRAGARKPDITTVEAFKRSLLGAKSIAYAKEGASGVAFAALIRRLGIAEDLKAKSKLTATGEEVGEAVVRGEAELGVLPVSEILPVRGAELLGTFPADTQSYIVMVAAVAAGAKAGDAARDLVKFLVAPSALPVLTAKGMERPSIAAAPVGAQEPVKGVANPEALFTDKDSKLNRNKQAALHIMKDLLQCNRWDEADKWLTARYIQHNPNVTSGREAVVKFFGSRPKTPTCDKLTTPVVAVLADGDLVTVVIAREYKESKDPSKSYTSTWFDMWRMVDGKADEHWDPATRP